MPDSPWFYALAGFLAGWIMQWMLDRFYLRQKMVQKIADACELEPRELLTVRVRELERQRQELGAQLMQDRAAHMEQVAALRSELEQAKEVANGRFIADSGYAYVMDNGAGANEAKPVTRKRAATREPLRDIKGIGPVYEESLQRAGVVTFKQLAALSPEQLELIIAPEHWRRVDFHAWIEEAREKAEGGRDG